MTQDDHKFIEESLAFIQEIESLRLTQHERWSNDDSRKIFSIDIKFKQGGTYRIDTPKSISAIHIGQLTSAVNDALLNIFKSTLDDLKAKIKDKIC